MRNRCPSYVDVVIVTKLNESVPCEQCAIVGDDGIHDTVTMYNLLNEFDRLAG